MQKQQLTLEQTRHNCGYSIEQVSQLTGIPADTVKQCEANGMKAEAFHIHVLLALYKVSLSHINFNPVTTSEFIHNSKMNDYDVGKCMGFSIEV